MKQQQHHINYEEDSEKSHLGLKLLFLSLFPTIEIFTVFEQDPDSCLYFVNTLSFNVTTVPFEFISLNQRDTYFE